MTEKLFWEKFVEYLTEDAGLTEESAKSYCSYAKNAMKHFMDAGFADCLYTADTAATSIPLAEQLIARLAEEIKSYSASTPVSHKTLQNYKSGAAMLIPFLGNELADDDGYIDPSTLAGHIDVSYGKPELTRVFKSRLATQDRVYASSSFPARLITKINKREYKLYDRLIADIKFLCSADGKRFVRFKDVTKVVISGGLAYVESNGSLLPVYTESYEGGKSKGFRHANVGSVALLSLDHESPMKEELEKALKNSPLLERLSTAYKAYHAANKGPGASKIATAFYKEHYLKDTYDKKALMAEILSFINGLRLSIMHKCDNSSKNSNVV